MTMVAPLHLMLFGCRKIDLVDNNIIRLDNWLNFDMDPKVASYLAALRPAIEELVTKAAESPTDILSLDENYTNLIEVVKELCVMNSGDYTIKRETGITPNQQRAGGGGGPGRGGGKFSRGGGNDFRSRGNMGSGRGFGGYGSGRSGNNWANTKRY